jgi:hypothetical protein
MFFRGDFHAGNDPPNDKERSASLHVRWSSAGLPWLGRDVYAADCLASTRQANNRSPIHH